MAKLPNAESLGPLPSARSGRPIARIDLSAPGRAAAGLGKSIQGLGAALSAHDSAAKDFDTENRFQEFKWNEEKALDKQIRETEPGAVDGFADQWAEGYKERAGEFARSIPDEQREKFDGKLFGAERKLYGGAAQFARKEQKRSALVKIDERRDTEYLSRARAGETPDQIREDFENLVFANPYLSPIEKDEKIRDGLGELEEAHLQGRLDRGEDLETILKDLHGSGEKREKKRPQSVDRQALISVRLETGKTDPLEGVSNVSKDAGGTKSYGNFGLNSQKGGSIYDFVRSYGKQFGLTAKPGTVKFDAQWENAAGAAPDEMHEAEMKWYSTNISSGTQSRLRRAGVPVAIAQDPRVKAYFSDRSIQQGTGSIDKMGKHKRRINEALADADGDPIKFLEAMNDLDRDALTHDFPTALRTGVYSEKGHDTRLDGRLEMALQAAGETHQDEDDNYDGPYPHLSARRREVLAGKARLAGRAKVKQQVDDSVEQLRTTGDFPVDENGESALDRAARVNTPTQFENARVKWNSAQIEFEMMNGLNDMTDLELTDRLTETEPKTSQDLYSERVKLHGKLARRIGDMRELRDEDPARAVAENPKVQVAEQGVLENPEDPEFMQKLARARVDAQEAIGIPEGLRTPITKDEARVRSAGLKGLDGAKLKDATREMIEKSEEDFGPYARSVVTSIMDLSIKDRDTTDVVSGVLHKTLKGQEPKASDLRKSEEALKELLIQRSVTPLADPFQQLGLTDAPNPNPMNLQPDPAAYYGSKPPVTQPPESAVQALRDNPALAAQFERKYGQPAASYLDAN